MATLVLSAVGTVIGGPVGGLIGSVIGNGLDRQLLGKRTQGPRLGDLSVQTSSYGTPIPKLFGRMRVAGTVIWSTDLIEDRNKEGGGKGRPKTTTYSYSVSFAVALSGRPLRSVGRIWADGKLLRGVAGDWKSELAAFRVHTGADDAGVDPLIASIEGAAATPAYDDLAYVVFEALQLGDFGNRIPSLTFEVEADDGAVSVASIASAMSGGAISGDAAAAVDGYAATGASVRAAVEDLADAFSLSLVDEGETLMLSDGGAEPQALATDELGAGAAGPGTARNIDRHAASSAPDEVQLSYYDPSRDWLAGLQRARLNGRPLRSESIELAASLSAGAAKACAEARLAVRDAARANASAQLGWRRLDLRPGGDIVLPGDMPARWRVSTLTFEKMVLGLQLRGIPAGVATGNTASAGRAVNDPDRMQGPTTLHVLDVPALGDDLLAAPRLLIAAAGQEPGWRGADLTASLDGGTSWQPIGRTAPPATMGSADSVLAATTSLLFDEAATVDVSLLNDTMWLTSAIDDALIGGANLALIGDELVQFGRADPIGGNRFRLGRLLRGRRGTEWAMATHEAGERFVLLEPASLLAYDAPAASIGGRFDLIATGIGDPAPVRVTATIAGRSVRPPAPVRLVANRVGGDLLVSWIRRSRIGWVWSDGGDAPLGEESERYELTVATAAGVVRRESLAAPSFLYNAAAQAADGVATGATLAVAEAGTIALGTAAILILS